MGRTGYTRVLIVDNQPLYSEGLSSVLEKAGKFSVIGIESEMENALRLAEKEKPHLVIMEIFPGRENGLDLISKLKSASPEISILVISANEERFYSERVLRLGARGYVMKTASAELVMDAISTVLGGKVFLSENERERIFQALTDESARGAKDWPISIQKLSNRELEVFSLIGKGFSTIEIATRLNLSTKTIDTHKEHIKLKLHCMTSHELRQQAIEWSNHSLPV
ncbi:MAG: response regulator transcription factor [Treponema sp.]|nr:response regulator transcription factor [Treponema sp.]MCL2236682.1 response regulator transcription factor [Treponema sp.]